MREVLVSLSVGAGVVRNEGGLLVTGDVRGIGGSSVREEDRFQPVTAWFDADRSVVGGLLPPGAASAEVVDGRGGRVAAEVAGGAYVALIDQPNDGQEAIVCCRDFAGVPVRRPWASDYPSVPVSDAKEPCPACGAIDWEEYAPFEEWRSARNGTADGTRVVDRVVSCRFCGHEEPESTFFDLRRTAPIAETDAERLAVMARVRADLHKQRWLASCLTLRTADFPIYGVDGWPGRLAGSAFQGDALTEVTVHQYQSPDAQPFDRTMPVITIVTTREGGTPLSELELARAALKERVRRSTGSGRWPDASHAAVTLFLAARRREGHATILAARHSMQTLTIDGDSTQALMLAVLDGPWAAAVRHDGLNITISGLGVDPSLLQIAPITDPSAARPAQNLAA